MALYLYILPPSPGRVTHLFAKCRMIQWKAAINLISKCNFLHEVYITWYALLQQPAVRSAPPPRQRVLCRQCATETFETQATISMPDGTSLERGEGSKRRKYWLFFFTKLHLVLLLELELIISHTSTPFYSIGLTKTSSMCLLQSGVSRGKSLAVIET